MGTGYHVTLMTIAKGCGLAAIVGLLGFLAFCGFIGSRISEVSKDVHRDTAVKQNLADSVKLEFRCTKDSSLLACNFSIRNQAAVDLKDFEIRCDHSAPSGTQIDANTR